MSPSPSRLPTTGASLTADIATVVATESDATLSFDPVLLPESVRLVSVTTRFEVSGSSLVFWYETPSMSVCMFAVLSVAPEKVTVAVEPLTETE